MQIVGGMQDANCIPLPATGNFTFRNQTILNFLNWVLNEIVYERYMLIADRVPVLMESLVGSLMYPRVLRVNIDVIILGRSY